MPILPEKTEIEKSREFSLEVCWLEINVKNRQTTQMLHIWAEMASVLRVELMRCTGRIERIEKMLMQ